MLCELVNIQVSKEDNVKKKYICHIYKLYNNHKYDSKVNERIIKQASSKRFFDIQIDGKLNWKDHMSTSITHRARNDDDDDTDALSYYIVH